MIAYNHYIKFIPELKNDKKVEGSYSDVITVKQSTNNILTEELFCELPFFSNQERNISLFTDREFARTKKGQFWVFQIKDVVTFFWHSGILDLYYVAHDNFTEELMKYWCLHIVLPVFFTIEEIYDFLHAGAIEIEGKTILFVAESCGGKSTMTDFFMKQGHRMVSDDKVASYEKDGHIFAVPSHPYHRPYRKMEDLGFFVENFSFGSKPIHLIYQLEKFEKNAEITITEIQGVKKFTLLRHSSEINLPSLKSKRFNLLMKIANIVPVFKVKVPWDIQRLGEVHCRIVEHTKNINKRMK